MKTKGLFLSVLAGLTVAAAVFINYSADKIDAYVPRVKEDKESKKERKAKEYKGAMEWINARKVNPATGRIDFEDIQKAQKQYQALKKAQKSVQGLDMDWTELGPDNIGGRTRAILIDKDDYNLMFAGAVSGGLWKSTTGGLYWEKVVYVGDATANSDDLAYYANLAVTSICQTANGDIYFGTGEGFASPYPTNYNSGSFGYGIWKSTDRGQSFTRLESTKNDYETFKIVNKLAAHPTNANKVYATTDNGLQVTTDGGQTWSNPMQGMAGATNEGQDVRVASDGTVYCSLGGGRFYVSTDDGSTFNLKSIDASYQSSMSRIELAVSPQDPNYAYCQIAKGSGELLGVYKTTDKGENWTLIVEGGDVFNPLGTQGNYDNTIAVYPNNKNKIILGGQHSIYTYADSEGWFKKSEWMEGYYPYFVHADHHAIVFHPTNPDIIYIGTDGGIFKSSDGGETYSSRNKNYRVTQFYAIGYGPDGRVVGGTQDNGTLYMDYVSGNTAMNAYEVKGGDGGFCEISSLAPFITFTTTYFGSLARTSEPGQYANIREDHFYSPSILIKYWDSDPTNMGNQEDPAGKQIASFVTPIALWESANDVNSVEYFTFIADSIDTPDGLDYIPTGDTLTFGTFITGMNYSHILEENLNIGDTLTIQNPYQAMLAVGFNSTVYINRYPLFMGDISQVDTAWARVVDLDSLDVIGIPANGIVQNLEWSKDGDNLYFSIGNNLYRIYDILASRVSYANMHSSQSYKDYTIKTELVETFNNIISSISTNPLGGNELVVTLGGYGVSNVRYTSDATTGDVDFVIKQGNLPQIPVYASKVVWNDAKKVVVGTEYGIFATEDITTSSPTWVEENGGLEHVPVYDLRCQYLPNGWPTSVTNQGVIYAGTHGRGIFKCETFAAPANSIDEPLSVQNIETINIYPNPVQDYATISHEFENTGIIEVYDMQGKLVLQKETNKGDMDLQLNLSVLKGGNYIVKIKDGNKYSSGKIMKY